jgi:formate dehydrogenase
METLHWVREIIEKGRSGSPARAATGVKAALVLSQRPNQQARRPPRTAGITVKELIDEYCGGMLDGTRSTATCRAAPPAASCRPR